MQTNGLPGQSGDNTLAAAPFNAFLAGGPIDIPQQQRLVQVNVNRPENFVVQKGNGYEHFRPTGEFCDVDGLQVALLRWDYRTMIAE